MNIKANYIVHIAEDDKFIPNAFIPMTAKVSDLQDHKFFIINNSSTLKYSLNNAQANYEMGTIPILVEGLKRELPKATHVIIHCLNNNTAKIINALNIQVPITAIVYGFEYYAHMGRSVELLLPETSAIYKKCNQTRNPARFIKKALKLNQYCKKFNNDKEWSKAIMKVTNFAHYLPEEYSLFKKYFKFEAKYLEFDYGNLMQIAATIDGNVNDRQRNILIGCNAAVSNNHIDMFKSIDTSNLSDEIKIYCPLSYSIENEKYTQKVIEIGYSIFGQRFIPITDLLPLSKFNALVMSCKTVIYGNLRSQCGTSLWSAIYWGKAVYLYGKNPLFPFYKNLGVVLSEIKGQIDVQISLSQSDQISNRNILAESFSDEKSQTKYKTLFSIC